MEKMDRLTHKNKRGYFEACGDMTGLSLGYDGGNSVVDGNIVDRRAAYEDTGRAPEEITQAQQAMQAALGLACEVQAARAENSRLRAELEAAVGDVLDAAIIPCEFCKRNPSNGGACDMDNDNHEMFSCWQWRGPRREEER